MRRINSNFLAFTATALACFATAFVAPIATAAPIYDEFGPLDNATFGGSGIPNEEVAVSTQIIDGDVTITVAMSATQRYSNPVVTNDGAGTYFAGPGSNFGGNNESTTEGALWNFNYYINVEGANGATPQITDYQFDLYYDFDTTFDNSLATLGNIDITAAVAASAAPSITLIEDSQNLLFGYLTTGVPGFVFPPAGAFDANAFGEYNFALQVTNNGFSLETVAIDVQVGDFGTNGIPEPSTAMMLVALSALSLVTRRAS